MDIKVLFSKIQTPEELLNFMSKNINNGYLGKSGRVYHLEDEDFNNKWFDDYILEGKDDILETLYGNYWDQVELERTWFTDNKYEIKTIYEMVKLEYENNYPTHSFLVFKDEDGNWNWFENSDLENRGIHKFDSFENLLNFQYNKYVDFLKTFNIYDEEIKKIIMTEYEKPKTGINVENYLNWVINSKTLEYKKVI